MPSAALPLTKHPDIESQLVRVEGGVAVYPERHRFEALDAVSFTEIIKENLIYSPPGYGIRDTVDLFLHKLVLHMQTFIETSDISTVYSYINEGLGITLAPKSTTEFVYGKNKRYKKLLRTPRRKSPSAGERNII